MIYFWSIFIASVTVVLSLVIGVFSVSLVVSSVDSMIILLVGLPIIVSSSDDDDELDTSVPLFLLV